MLLPDNALGQDAIAFGCATAKINSYEKHRKRGEVLPDAACSGKGRGLLLISGSIEQGNLSLFNQNIARII
jgi:hypothetical protein